MDKRTSWVEWVLIIAIVVIAVVSVVWIAALTLFGPNIEQIFNRT